MVIAHRACWHKAPENSLKAIEACIKIGVDMVEIDVRRTRDGVLVLMHDATIDRMTNGQGPIKGLEFKTLKSLQLREGDGGAHAAITPLKIPTLEAVLRAIKGRILVNLDAKEDIIDSALILAEKIGVKNDILIKAEWPAHDPRLKSDRIRSAGFFMPKITQKNQYLSLRAKSYSWMNPIAFEVKARTEEYIKEGSAEIALMGARLWINTLSQTSEKAAGHIDRLALRNPDAHWGRLITLGVNMIQTDEPAALLNYLKLKGFHK